MSWSLQIPRQMEPHGKKLYISFSHFLIRPAAFGLDHPMHMGLHLRCLLQQLKNGLNQGTLDLNKPSTSKIVLSLNIWVVINILKGF